MKYVDFFGHQVSKLIVGDNPFNGHSYITEYISKEEMINFHTETCRDMINYHAVFNGIYFHSSTSNNFKISAIRTNLPFNTCLK